MEKRNHDFEEEMFDDLLGVSARDIYDIDISDIDFSNAVTPSKDFQAKMNTMIEDEKKSIKRAKRWQRMPKMAASIALILVVAGISLNSVSAWREPIYNILFHTTADNDKNKVDIIDADLEKYLPSYVPDGFELVENGYDEDIYAQFLSYQNDTSYFDICIYIDQPDLYGNYSDFTPIKYKTKTFYTNNSNLLVFRYKNDTISITHNFDDDTALKILSSISY